MRECFDEGVLQSFNDGELSRVEAERVSLHLTQCGRCSTALSELLDANELTVAVLAPEFETAVPTEQLRSRIDAAISGMNLRIKKAHQPSLLATIQNWIAQSFRQPVFAYSSVAALLLFATIIAVSYFKARNVTTPPQNVAQVTPAPKSSPGAVAIVNPPAEVETPEPRADKPVKKVRRPVVNSAAQTVAVKLMPGEKSYLRTIAVLDSTIKANDRPMRPALRAEYERNLALVDRALAAARNAAKSNPDDPDAAEFVFAAYQSKVDLLSTVADARTYNRQR
jgi:anti-sigma factor RsiW